MCARVSQKTTDDNIEETVSLHRIQFLEIFIHILTEINILKAFVPSLQHPLWSWKVSAFSS